MIVDSFLFLNELDLLEIRLNSLAPYVDHFVLGESYVTFTGNEKPLYYEENMERFKDFNIKHVVIPANNTEADPWKREYFQRECLIKSAIEDMHDDDNLLMSDCDEIPNMDTCKGEGAFLLRLYYYYFNCYTGKNNWSGTTCIKKRNISNAADLRNRRKKMNRCGKGWHFSYIGSSEDIIYKIESFSHTEHNTRKKKDSVLINKTKLMDPFDRQGLKEFKIEMPSGPQWLLDNRKKYSQYFYGSE